MFLFFFFFLLCPTVARTCQRQETYAAFWHFEDVNNFFTCALRSHCESSGGWQSAGVCWGRNLSSPPSLSLFSLHKICVWSEAAGSDPLWTPASLWVELDHALSLVIIIIFLLLVARLTPRVLKRVPLNDQFLLEAVFSKKEEKLDCFPRTLACSIQLDCMRCIANKNCTFLRNSEKNKKKKKAHLLWIFLTLSMAINSRGQCFLSQMSLCSCRRRGHKAYKFEKFYVVKKDWGCLHMGVNLCGNFFFQKKQNKKLPSMQPSTPTADFDLCRILLREKGKRWNSD